MKSSIKILEAAYRLLKKGWTQKTYATDKNGEQCSYRKSDNVAVCYCLSGAILRSGGLPGEAAYQAIYQVLPKQYSYMGIVAWNDQPERTQEEVLDVVKKAIKGLKEKVE